MALLSKLLTDEYPLIVLPELAKQLGTNAAMILQQIHYWSQKKCGSIIDGVRWIYNTYQQWQEQLPFLSVSTIKRAIAKLKDLKLILVERHDKSEWNQRNYYCINYEALEKLQLPIGSICSTQLDQVELTSQTTLNHSSISTENTTENTTDTEVVEEKRFSQKAEEIIKAYEEQLKIYGIYKLSWDGDNQIPNPRLKPILAALKEIPPDRAERSIKAFLGWIRNAKNVEDKYKAMYAAITRGWD